MWRGLLALSCVAACSFRPGALATGHDGAPVSDAPVRPDAAPIDAAIDAALTVDAMVPDACPDVDGDGVCDNVDVWLCGVNPTPPPSTVTITRGAGTVTMTNIALGGAQILTASPSQNLAMTFHYVVTDTSCQSNCIDQIEYGLEPGGRIGCAYDQQTPKMTGASGTATKMLTAPSTPGAYELRTNLGQNFSCNYNGATMWWSGTPPAANDIALLCVH